MFFSFDRWTTEAREAMHPGKSKLQTQGTTPRSRLGPCLDTLSLFRKTWTTQVASARVPQVLWPPSSLPPPLVTEFLRGLE